TRAVQLSSDGAATAEPSRRRVGSPARSGGFSHGLEVAGPTLRGSTAPSGGLVRPEEFFWCPLAAHDHDRATPRRAAWHRLLARPVGMTPWSAANPIAAEGSPFHWYSLRKYPFGEHYPHARAGKRDELC